MDEPERVEESDVWRWLEHQRRKKTRGLFGFGSQLPTGTLQATHSLFSPLKQKDNEKERDERE
jgi:hypothetical protein